MEHRWIQDKTRKTRINPKRSMGISLDGYCKFIKAEGECNNDYEHRREFEWNNLVTLSTYSLIVKLR